MSSTCTWLSGTMKAAHKNRVQGVALSKASPEDIGSIPLARDRAGHQAGLWGHELRGCEPRGRELRPPVGYERGEADECDELHQPRVHLGADRDHHPRVEDHVVALQGELDPVIDRAL